MAPVRILQLDPTMRASPLVLAALSITLLACPPSRPPAGGEPGDCDGPAHTVAVWTQDTGMGVNVCVWVDNDTGGDLHVSSWNEWDVSLCGGQPVDVTLPDALTSGTVIPAGESREILGWFGACTRDAATTVDGGVGEPALVFALSPDPDDDTCWSEARSPRLTGWYCEG